MFEDASVVHNALHLIRFVHKPLLEFGLVQVLDVLLTFQTVGLRRPLRDHCSQQSLYLFPNEVTCPDHEFTATPIDILKLIFELFS